MDEDQIAFIGVGNMGAPICRNILRYGIKVRVYDIDPAKSAAIQHAGAAVACDIPDVVTAGGVVLSMVPDDAALLDIALGDKGVLASLGAGGVHLSLSTVAPATISRLAEPYADAGVGLVSATVLGRPDVAERADLTVFLAGPEDDRLRVQPLLAATATKIHSFGSHAPAANIVKLGANFLIMAAIEAMAESAALMQANGVDPDRFLKVIADTPLFSSTVYRGYGAMIGSNEFQPALFPVPLGLKDARLVQALGGDTVATPIAAIVEQHLQACQEAGWADDDWSVIGRLLRSRRG